MVDGQVGRECVILGRDLARLRVDPALDAAVLVARLEDKRVTGQAILEEPTGVWASTVSGLPVGPPAW